MRKSRLAILAAVAAVLAIPVAAGAATPTTHVRVGPSAILPRTNVVIRFRQPQTTGVHRSERTTESLRITGPVRPGCVGSDTTKLATANVGTMMRRTLRPKQLGGYWCTGTYRGQLMVSTQSVCLAGPIHAIGGEVVACPMLMTAPRTVATFHFRVVSAR